VNPSKRCASASRALRCSSSSGLRNDNNSHSNAAQRCVVPAVTLSFMILFVFIISGYTSETKRKKRGAADNCEQRLQIRTTQYFRSRGLAIRGSPNRTHSELAASMRSDSVDSHPQSIRREVKAPWKKKPDRRP
jgi:hypothetical protein